jgi:c-di-GMP-binding flagellar brake protein YcgR
MNNQEQERRRFLRIPESLPVTYELLLNAKTEQCHTKDISQEGIRFLIDTFIPKFSLLKIKFNLDKLSFSFDALVRVVWIKSLPQSDKYEVGVEFISIPKEAAEHLINYIKSILRKNQ